MTDHIMLINIKENVATMENHETSSWNNFLTPQDYLYVSIMKQEAFMHLIFQGVMTITYIFLVIPSNLFTLMVIVKNKDMWTSSNTVLAINALFMMIGSAAILFLRQAHFPLLLYGDSDRIYANTVAWWVCTMTFRIGNNR